MNNSAAIMAPAKNAIEADNAGTNWCIARPPTIATMTTIRNDFCIRRFSK
ncbi:hypothetical protein NFHSH190041_01140 [Shewanella sp. NFH-SH190041]|nr:hypothetical protein NFHSH190041_01140 [Shewanella sp. NFH-SH190041]